MNPIERMIDQELQIIKECLDAAVSGPFFPDWYRTRPGPAYFRRLASEHAAERGGAVPPPAPTAAALPPRTGLWLIPGADAILGPPPAN